MTLDPISARMFPRLARYAGRLWWCALACSHVSAFLAGVAITFVFLGYHQHVATDNQNRLLGRFAALEAQYEKDHPSLRVTKAQANDWAWEKVKGQEKGEVKR